jgi:2-polyprenyl-3-methyl-5-hydroxy-6-metoxy-1,4-benzoquinol methylase
MSLNYSRRNSNKANKVIGVDKDTENIDIMNLNGYNVLLGDVETLRLRKYKNRFDVVVCGELIEHLSCPGRLLDTVNYHLKQKINSLVYNIKCNEKLLCIHMF